MLAYEIDQPRGLNKRVSRRRKIGNSRTSLAGTLLGSFFLA
jgi:hypothetical protein